MRTSEQRIMWTVIGLPFARAIGTSGAKKKYVKCQCECGRVSDVSCADIKAGKSTNCGCVRSGTVAGFKLSHGLINHPIYRKWKAMKQRCYDRKYKRYADYGGRGIRICDEWKNDFRAFYEWAIGHGWKQGLTIDRFPNNDGDYEPNNCRWVTWLEQANNKRTSRLAEAFGQTQTVANWSRDPRCVVPYGTLIDRLRSGWIPERAITEKSR